MRLQRISQTVAKRTAGRLSSPLVRLPLILLILAVIAVPVTTLRADGKGRVASDLKKEESLGSPADVVPLVATVDGADPATIAARVADLGGKVHGHYKNVGVVTFELPLGAVDAFAATDGIKYVAPDRPVNGLASPLDVTTGASLVLPGLLSGSGYDGTGVGVAVIDSGVAIDHYDLQNPVSKTHRVVQSVDFTGTGRINDPFGHGTHVAGLVAGNGTASLALGKDFRGVAPGAGIVNLKVLDGTGRGYVSNVIAAIDYAISAASTFNIRVLNLSLAAPPIDSYADDPLCQAVARATSAGLVVVAAAGNFGMDGSGNKVYGGIASPGISPEAITVGAAYTLGTDARSDDIIAPFSSRGPTLSHSTDPATGAVIYDDLPKPDLVAPGARLVSLERDSDYLVTTYPVLHFMGTKSNGKYMMLSGTSMSAGVVSGAAALILQANPSLTPHMVKAILMYTAQIMNGPDLFEQGAGLLNIEGAVRLATSLSTGANALVPGDLLLATSALPNPQSVIAGETVVWSQSLIWGGGMLRGAALFTTDQLAYSQSLIWGIGRYDAWGAGVTYYDGLYASDYVVFGGINQWNYVTWGDGNTTSSGLIWTRDLSASGLIWGNQAISNDFFDVSPSSLIWGINGYGGSWSGLIWGICNWSGLIWGVNSGW